MRLILFLFFFASQVAFSQACYPEKKKYKKLVRKIEKLITKGSYYNAMDLLDIRDESAIFYLLKSEIFWKRKEFFYAENEAVRAIDVCPESFPRAYYFLGEIAYNRKDYVAADVYLEKAIDLQLKDPYYSNAVMIYKEAQVLADIINSPVIFEPCIVDGISTENDEYLPIISPDQQLAFFTRRSNRKSLHSITSNSVEEFICSKQISGCFEPGKAMSYPFNQGGNEGGASITIDNRVLYFTKCIRNDIGYNNCDIYYVNKENGIWSDIKEFPKQISRVDSWDSQPTVSSDGNTIIFSSDRPGGYGKMDLYEISRVNGVWTDPINVGPIINSDGFEKSPYLHTDGMTLFFASTRFPSLGGFDIFYSRKDSLGSWQEPVNIGYPINTVADEISLFVDTDGNDAYFASNNINRLGGWDIYSFELYDDAKPERVLFLKGSLFNDSAAILDNIELEIKNLTTQEITTVTVDAGSYVSSLTLGRNDDVLITIKKEGYAFNSQYISADDSSFKSPSDLNFDMEPLKEGSSFNIDNIYFATNSYDLSFVTRNIVIEFAKYLEVNSNIVIEINGFTDDIGDKLDNQLLSEYRAQAVMDLVLMQGVSAERVSCNGFGESFPISSNETEEGRAVNRRTEFKIISK